VDVVAMPMLSSAEEVDKPRICKQKRIEAPKG
jgi:hypothetical protein